MKKPFFYISIFIVSCIYAKLSHLIDWDLWARLAVGKIYFQIGQVLKNDIFSYTPTKPIWVDHEWGSGVLFYYIVNYFGDIGLVVFKISTVFLLLLLISRVVKLNNPAPNAHLNILFYILTVMGTYYGAIGSVRCQLFTFLFFALWIYVLERVRRGEKRLLWIIPATSVVWVNLHGGIVAGFGLLIIYGIGEYLNGKPFKHYFLTLIPSALVTLINPYGIQYWEFIIHAATMPRVTIAEWFPTGILPFARWKGFKIFGIVAILSFVAYLIKSKFRYKEIDKVKILLLLITFYLAMAHNKHQTLFVISGACFLYHDFYNIFGLIGKFIAEKISKTPDRFLSVFSKVKNIMVFGSIIITGSLIIFSSPMKLTIHQIKYPVGSVEFLKLNNFKGNVATVFHWGSFVAWKLYPDFLIAEDGRYEEVYPDEVHFKVYDLNYKITKNWLNILTDYHTDVIIYEKGNVRGYKALLENREWKPVYTDLVSTVFVPADKARKLYKMPVLDQEKIDREKFDTNIDFK